MHQAQSSLSTTSSPTTTAKMSPKHPVRVPETARCTHRTQVCPGPGRCCSSHFSRAGQGHFPEVDSCFGTQLFYCTPNTRDPPAAAAAPNCTLLVWGPVPSPTGWSSRPPGTHHSPVPTTILRPLGCPGAPQSAGATSCLPQPHRSRPQPGFPPSPGSAAGTLPG